MNITSNVLHSNNLKKVSHTIHTFANLAVMAGYDYISWNDKIFSVLENGELIDTDFYLENGRIKTNYDTQLVNIIDVSVIGSEVIKISGKPFKSGEKEGIVTGFSLNEQDPKSHLAYVIDNDTLVNINRCKLS